MSQSVGTFKALFDETPSVSTLGDVKMCGWGGVGWGGVGCILYLDTTVHGGEMDSFTDRILRVMFRVLTGYCAVGLRVR
jgi:hypothetical protein